MNTPILIESWFVRTYADGIALMGIAINHPARPEKPSWQMQTSYLVDYPKDRTLRQGDVVLTQNRSYLLGEPLFREG